MVTVSGLLNARFPVTREHTKQANALFGDLLAKLDQVSIPRSRGVNG